MEWTERFGFVRSLLQTRQPNYNNSQQLIQALGQAYAIDPARCVGELCAYTHSALTSHPDPWPVLVFDAHPDIPQWWTHIPSLIWLSVGTMEQITPMVELFPQMYWSIDFSWMDDVDLEDVWAVLSQPWLTRLYALTMDEMSIGDDGVHRLTQLDSVCNLRQLSLVDNQITNKGASYLAKCNGLTHLRVLDLTDNPIKKTGASALTRSSRLVSMVELSLDWTASR